MPSSRWKAVEKHFRDKYGDGSIAGGRLAGPDFRMRLGDSGKYRGEVKQRDNPIRVMRRWLADRDICIVHAKNTRLEDSVVVMPEHVFWSIWRWAKEAEEEAEDG